MKRIIIHWTAGTNQACQTDLLHYHYLITGNGELKQGLFHVLANKVCKNDENKKPLYAAHCGGGNTGSIGVAACGMYGFNNRFNTGNYPLTKIQCEKLFKTVANLSKQYNIIVSPDTIMTHYEFGQKNPKTTSFGKIDIIYLSPYPYVTKNEIGDFIRNKVNWYRKN